MPSDNYSPKMKRSRWDSPNDGNQQLRTRVVAVRNLPPIVTEGDLMAVLKNFGPISYVSILPIGGMALVEFEDLRSAEAAVMYSRHGQVLVREQLVLVDRSPLNMIQRKGLETNDPHRVLIMTITEIRYPITISVIYRITQVFGNVLRIAINRQPIVQALVEFDTVEAARKAKRALNGADIYVDCCSLKVEFANMNQIYIMHNDNDNWDFTVQAGRPMPSQMIGVLSMNTVYNGPLMNYQHAHDTDYRNGRGGFYQRGRGRGGFGRRQPIGKRPSRQYSQAYEPDDESGRVIMISGINPSKINCDGLFNLLCQYGNVLRVLFMKTRNEVVLVEMARSEQARTAICKLNSEKLNGTTLSLGLSKHPTLHEVRNPFTLPDGTESYKDYTESRHHRFSTPEAAAKNRLHGVSAVLNWFNAPPNLTPEHIKQICKEGAGIEPTRVFTFPKKSERGITGLVEFSTEEDAMDVLIRCNHTPVESPFGRLPYILKFAFAAPWNGPRKRRYSLMKREQESSMNDGKKNAKAEEEKVINPKM